MAQKSHLEIGGIYSWPKSKKNVVRFLQLLMKSDRFRYIYLKTKFWPRNVTKFTFWNWGYPPEIKIKRKKRNPLSLIFYVERPFQRYLPQSEILAIFVDSHVRRESWWNSVRWSMSNTSNTGNNFWNNFF